MSWPGAPACAGCAIHMAMHLVRFELAIPSSWSTGAFSWRGTRFIWSVQRSGGCREIACAHRAQLAAEDAQLVTMGPRAVPSYALRCAARVVRNARFGNPALHGLLRELNPGPLGPKPRIMPLDQAAGRHYRDSKHINVVCNAANANWLLSRL